MSIKSGTVHAEMVMDISDVEKNLSKADRQIDTFASNLEKKGQRMEKMGSAWCKRVTLPILGIGAASLKVSMDFEASMSEVQAISGATGEDLEKLERKARDMGATTKFSATQSAEAMRYMAMAGWSTTQIMDGLDGVMNLAAASGEDLALVSDIVTDSMTAFGMEASQAGEFADLLANTSRNANTNVAMMGETFKYVAPVAGSLGYSAEDCALAIGLMANAGIKGSQAGTTLRSSMVRLQKPTAEAASAMKELGIETTDAEGNMIPFHDLMVDLRESFGDLTEAQQAQYAATIFGQESMAGMLAIINASEEDFEKLTDATREYNGTAEEMADIMDDNLKGRLNKLKSQLGEVAIQLGEILIPMVEKLVDRLAKWVDKFASLDPKTQEMIVKTALLTAAVGPLLKIGGKVTKGTGSVIKIFGKMNKTTVATTSATKMMGAGIGKAGMAAKAGAVLFNPWTLAIAAGTVAVVGLTRYMKKDCIPAVELFDDTISESTQEAVGSFLELEEEATKSLNQLAWSGAEVTEDMAGEITGNFDQMTTQVTDSLEQQKVDALQSLDELFSNSKDMSEAEKEEMLKITEEKYNNQIQKTEEGNKRIAEILEKASEEKRALTKAEQQEIDGIREEMQETAVRVLSESEAEQLAIMERLKQESGKISALQAAEIVENSLEQKEKSIQAAEDEYNDRLKYAAELRAEGSEESIKLADKVAAEAKKQKNEAVKNAKQMHKGVVNEAKKQAGEHVNQIDWETGQVKSKWQRTREWFRRNPISRRYRTEDDGGNPSKPGNNAHGTSFWKGGRTWVGEQGRELIDLPRGTKIYSNEQSEKMASKVEHTGTITVKGVNDNNQLMGAVDIIMSQLRMEART